MRCSRWQPSKAVSEIPDVRLFWLEIGRLHRRLSHDFDAGNHLKLSLKLGASLAAKLELAEMYFEAGSHELRKNLLERIRTDLQPH